MHIYEDSGEPYQNLPVEKLGENFSLLYSTGDPKNGVDLPAEKLGENFSLLIVQGLLKMINLGLIFPH